MLFMSCTCTPARFGASMCSFCLRVEILGSVLGPVARFVHVQCFFMSCTCTPARFGVPLCSFCLRVEICAHFWAQMPVLGLDFDSSRHFHVMYVHTSILRMELHFLPQSGNFCTFWAQFLGPSSIFCARAVLFSCHVLL